MLDLKGGKSRIWLIAVLCIVVVVGVVAALLLIPRGPTSRGNFTLKVIDGSSGAALAGVTATIDNKTVETNSDGIATFDLPDGTYTVNLQKDGYEPKSYTFEVSGENSLTIDMSKL